MKILMFSWEFPPMIAGGLAMACYGMVKSLLKQGVEVDLVLPTKELIYFAFRKVEDVDTLPVVFLDPEKQKAYMSLKFENIFSKTEYVGMSAFPETYYSPAVVATWSKLFENMIVDRKEFSTLDEKILFNLTQSLVGDEDIFKKVQEMASRAARYSQELEYDMIHAHDWLTYPAGIIAKKISGKPLITQIHATEFDRAGGYGDGRIHNLESDGMNFADMVIAVSKYTANMIISRYRVDSGKIRVLYNAYDVGKIPETRARLFKGPTILFLGRITLQKGPDYFVEVADRVLKSNPHARFIVAGSGDMARKVLHRSASLKLKNRFLFAGFLNRKQVEEIFNSVDIYVMPSVSEPFGIAPLEAMAYGVTAVISKQSGVSEVVQNAYKVDFWDIDEMARIIDYLIKNPDKCKEIGMAGKEEVFRIGWDEVATKLIDYYRENL
ncbi:MAG: glycosyltransferase family 4 protein [Candidatus Cloacimonetes bacterium]|nr:glycosyltransferase family 4 protein [Candidatus Cloacimonadota bacterium]